MLLENWDADVEAAAYQYKGSSSKGKESHVDKRHELRQGLAQLFMDAFAGSLTPASMHLICCSTLLDHSDRAGLP